MSFTQWRIQRARAKQKRIALQMLALSGVVRPSHVEPRYSVPLLKLKALNQAQPCEFLHRPNPSIRRTIPPLSGARLQKK
ncbi:exported protein of unknown function [Nitrospira moscoviensis]|uniref:Uncharacterized protein n=1 Tax=Nitrospira moscoviensis TaxID=42253 RepID=A0A0K2GAY2_NITMO|nr:exported protein of unknown function [Nitrospira moscoviensis]